MTSLIVAISLVITPAPIAPHQETPPWNRTTAATTASTTPARHEWSFLPPELLPTTPALIELPATNDAGTGLAPVLVPTATIPISPLTLRERALLKLTDLGAPGWVVGVFDCIGWYESGWQNKRSRTGDSGVFQINDIHLPELRRRGLDPWVPEDAAIYAWSLSREGTTFTPWTVHGLCGV